MLRQVVIYADGGSRGNPGPGAAAFVLTDSAGSVLAERAFFLGRCTNNAAEYSAVLKSLEAAVSLGAASVTLYSDSELVVRQINGQYKVKGTTIKPLFCRISDLLSRFSGWSVHHIGRELNRRADALVNKALDLGRDIEASPLPGGTIRREPLRLGVLISGGGRTLFNILDHIKQGSLNAEVSVVISSRSTAAGVARARAAGLSVDIIRVKDSPDINDFSRCIEKALAAANVELVIQAGWLCLWKIPPRYVNRVMNIHPALLPGFGGSGMWGEHVHQAVLKAGCKVSGCTVHFCTDEYDNGPIIVQRCCPVLDSDSPETLAARVFEQECIAYPEAIRLFAEGWLVVREGKVIVSAG